MQHAAERQPVGPEPDRQQHHGNECDHRYREYHSGYSPAPRCDALRELNHGVEVKARLALCGTAPEFPELP
ncbi:hypothetical protein GCM10022222_16530 [Amycolatopsis ultiminotia]|uniref:Uncharacterized protein n=1 Tax=Amycolatopsis ultiminotia TaxID=543629 RepID=A0ABP6VHF6_9PSEU